MKPLNRIPNDELDISWKIVMNRSSIGDVAHVSLSFAVNTELYYTYSRGEGVSFKIVIICSTIIILLISYTTPVKTDWRLFRLKHMKTEIHP